MELIEALQLADTFFPSGPEEIAAQLKIEIQHCQLSGCDGWCVNGPNQTIIRINNGQAKTRQRFTLAHEIVHLLLGNGSDVCRLGEYAEEAEVNEIAAEILLPKTHLLTLIGHNRPIGEGQIAVVVSRANVSWETVVRRIVKNHAILGIKSGCVARIQDHQLSWTFPNTSQWKLLTPQIRQGLRSGESSPQLVSILGVDWYVCVNTNGYGQTLFITEYVS